jgi:putative ABC transport system permease protein
MKQKETLSMVKGTWEKLFHYIPLSFDFLEDKIKNGVVIQIFYKVQDFIIADAIFSFFIALLGLFGISIFTARQRVKEIGIRRINGASLVELLIHMNRKLIQLVSLSIIISTPIIMLSLKTIIKDDGTIVRLSFGNYVIVAVIILTLSILTMSWQNRKAATRNPVEALRYE